MQCSTEALGKYLRKQTAPTNPLQLADILSYQDRLCSRSENLVLCICCSADGWSASFILRFSGDDNPQHNGSTGDWNHLKRNSMFFGLFTIWMAIWEAAQQNTEVLPGIWSEGVFVLLSLVASEASRSNIYSFSWIKETLEGPRRAYYATTPDMTQGHSMGPRLQNTSLHEPWQVQSLLLMLHRIPMIF